MIYFTSLETDKSKSIGITNLLSNITTKDHSHKGGWTKLLKCQLINAGYNNVTIISNKERLGDFDSIIFDVGAEFSGTINLFGGLDAKAANRVQELRDFEGQLFSWQHELPCLDAMITMRQNNKSTHPSFIGMPKLNLVAKTFDHVEHKKHLLFADSHGPAVWTPDMMIDRKDGRTLFGCVRDDEINKAIEKYDADEVTIYLGNIDIRHHICRVSEDNQFSIGFTSFNLVRNLHNSLPPGIKVNYIKPLYIEDESRKLPGTGYYKGTPFFGSWFNRNHARYTIGEVMSNLAEEDNYGIWSWPENFVNEAGQMKFDMMERPKSVHMSPMHYRWNLDNNEERYVAR